MLFGWPLGSSSALPGFMRMAGLPGAARLMSALPANQRAVRAMFRSIGHGPSLKAGRITAADIAWCLALMRDTDTLRSEAAPGRSYISPLRGLRPALVLSDATLAKVTVPTYLLWGEKDPFGGPAAAREFVKRLPNADLEILPGAGHAPWLDELDRCVASARAFLGK
jgi:pimeloyl-ACP methyl ester carboxylesterase